MTINAKNSTDKTPTTMQADSLRATLEAAVVDHNNNDDGLLLRPLSAATLAAARQLADILDAEHAYLQQARKRKDIQGGIMNPPKADVRARALYLEHLERLGF